MKVVTLDTCETCMPLAQFKRRYWFFAHAPNITNITGNYRFIWKDFLLESRFLPSSQTSGRMYITVVQLIVWCEKCSPTVCRYWKTIIDFKTETGFALRRAVFGLSQDRVCTDSFEHFSVKSVKRDEFNPSLFSWVNTFKMVIKERPTSNITQIRIHVISCLEGILHFRMFTRTYHNNSCQHFVWWWIHVVPLQQFDTNLTRLQVWRVLTCH